MARSSADRFLSRGGTDFPRLHAVAAGVLRPPEAKR